MILPASLSLALLLAAAAEPPPSPAGPAAPTAELPANYAAQLAALDADSLSAAAISSQLDALLQIGVSPLAILSAAGNKSTVILPILIRKGCLPMQEPLVRQQVFRVLFNSDDEELWQLAGQQGLRWISPLKQSFDDDFRYIYPGNLTGWLRLRRFTGLDLAEESILDRIFEDPITPAEHAAARSFLKDHEAAVRRLDKEGRSRLFTCNRDWLALLLEIKLDANQRNSQGETPLFARYAAEDLRLLLAAGADARVLDKQGRSTLYGKNEAGVKLLLAAGADARLVDKGGGNVLFVYHDCMATPLLLAAGADPRQIDKAGRNALFHVNHSSTLDIPLLVKGGADPKAFDKEGNGVLFAQHEDYVIADLIAAGADINQRSPDGRKTIWNHWTLGGAPYVEPPPPPPSYEDQIHIAAIDGRPREQEARLPWMEALLKNGADPALADAEGRTPLMLFARIGRPLLLRRLFEEGAKARLEARDKNGHHALDAIFLKSPTLPEGLAVSDARKLLCARLLQKQGLKLTINAATPDLDDKLWRQWQQLESGTASDADRARIIADLLDYRDDAFSREFLAPGPGTLAACVEACEWRLALALLTQKPELIQPGSETCLALLAELRERRKSTWTGGCCVHSGFRQDDFDAFEAAVKKLAQTGGQ